MNNFEFAESHIFAIRSVLGDLPSKIFFDIDCAPIQRDLKEATDLVLSVSGGDIAVRVRRIRHYLYRTKNNLSYEWSIRVYNNGFRTEIHKLRDGFARWYFMAYSLNDKDQLIDWWLIDLDKIRINGILNQKWETHDNKDGTAGMYIPISALNNCIIAQADKNAVIDHLLTTER